MGHSSEISNRVNTNRALAHKYLKRKRALQYDRMTRWNPSKAAPQPLVQVVDPKQAFHARMNRQKQARFWQGVQAFALLLVVLLALILINWWFL